jgi:hypothetical protein
MVRPLNGWETLLVEEIERSLEASDPRLRRLLRRRVTPWRLWLWRPRPLAVLVILAALVTFAAVLIACMITLWAAAAAAPGALAFGAAYRRLSGLCLFGAASPRSDHVR